MTDLEIKALKPSEDIIAKLLEKDSQGCRVSLEGFKDQELKN